VIFAVIRNIPEAVGGEADAKRKGTVVRRRMLGREGRRGVAILRGGMAIEGRGEVRGGTADSASSRESSRRSRRGLREERPGTKARHASRRKFQTIHRSDRKLDAQFENYVCSRIKRREKGTDQRALGIKNSLGSY